MTADEAWARVTLRMWGFPPDLLIPSDLAAIGEYDPQERSLFVEVGKSERGRLSDLLAQLELLLAEHVTALRVVAAASTVDLFVGWAPVLPQEAATFSRPLLQLLTTMNAEVVFDTYAMGPDEDE